MMTLDAGSSFASVNNEKSLAGMHEVKNPIAMETNAGSRVMDKAGTMPGNDKEVWCDPESSASMFGFNDIEEKHRVTTDNDTKDAFVAHTENGTVEFEHVNGSHCHRFPDECLETVRELDKDSRKNTKKG